MVYFISFLVKNLITYAYLFARISVLRFGLVQTTFQKEDDVGRLSSLLLDRSSAEPTKEALMTAICIGSRPLVEFILSLFYEFPQEECNGCKNSIAYPSHMTPLMLAAICNNFAIVQCLLLRNHRICLPHRPDCLCSECRRIARGLSKSVVTLDTYRAISNAFIK
uniref:ANK_REP_REGION domain-containing protein n=1 Tax=Parascaris equorum TaxID=6256 RepID=A0A914RYP1_PAREQ